MVNEGDTLQFIKKLLDEDYKKRIPEYKNDRKYIRYGKQIGKNLLYGAQGGFQVIPFVGGLPLATKIGKLEPFIRGVVPLLISAIGTAGTQFGIEKLNNKSWGTAGHNAISKGILDGGATLFGYGLKGIGKVFKEAVPEEFPERILINNVWEEVKNLGTWKSRKFEKSFHKSYPFLKSGYEHLSKNTRENINKKWEELKKEV